MAISGLIGAGAQDAVAELFQRQLLQQQLEQRQREAEQEALLRAAELAQREQQHKALQGWRDEEQAQGRAAAQANQQKELAAQGRRDNAANVLAMPGLSREQQDSELEQIALRSGDKSIIDLMQLRHRQTPEPKRYPITVPGPNGRPMRRLATEDELAGGVEEYEKPPAPDRPPRTDLTPGERVTQTRLLKNEYAKALGTIRELSRQSSMMDAGLDAARRGDLAAGSQAVLVTFQKILDPTSVVRESEYARSASGQSVLNRIEGIFDRLARGGAGIPLDELEKFANLAREFVKGTAESETSLRQQYTDIANEFGLNPALIIGAGAAPSQGSGGAGKFKILKVQ